MSCPRENINGEIEMGWNLIYKESGSNSRGGRSLSSTHLLVAPEWTPTMPLGVHIPRLRRPGAPSGHCPGASGGIGADSLMLFAVGRLRPVMLCGCFIARDQISHGGSLWRSLRSGRGKGAHCCWPEGALLLCYWFPFSLRVHAIYSL